MRWVLQKVARLVVGTLVAIAMLAVVEGVLRLVGPSPEPEKPPLHTRWSPDEAFEEEGGQVKATFQPERDRFPPFAATPTRARAMVFGGSSVRAGSGIPFVREFPTLVEQALRAAGYDLEVLNLGRPAFESSDIRLVVGEAVRYAPDLVVVYAGHNDIGNRYMEQTVGTAASSGVARLRRSLEGLALARTTRNVATSLLGPPRMASAALDAEARATIAASFRENLAEVIRTARGAGADVVLVTPIGDLVRPQGDQVPACPELLPGAWTYVDGHWQLDPNQDEAVVNAALEADPDCPEALLIRGNARRMRGDRGFIDDLRAARDNATLPMRASEENLAAMRSLASEEGVRLVDFEAAVVAQDGFPLPALFRDNLHLSETGHQRLAALLGPEVGAALEARGVQPGEPLAPLHDPTRVTGPTGGPAVPQDEQARGMEVPSKGPPQHGGDGPRGPAPGSAEWPGDGPRNPPPPGGGQAPPPPR